MKVILYLPPTMTIQAVSGWFISAPLLRATNRIASHHKKNERQIFRYQGYPQRRRFLLPQPL
jgi:hypothetical protein